MTPADPMTHPLYGLSLVEASAGTGKTTLLVRLYLRALLVDGLNVEQILVVTYTRAAAGELSVRIRQALAEAARLVDQVEEREPFWAALFTAAAEPDKVRERIAAALLAFDEKAVFTIHGFCQRTLADHAFEAGEAFANEQGGDEDALQLEIVADVWRRRIATRAPGYVEWYLRTFRSPGWLFRKVLKDPLMVSGPLVVEPDREETAVRAAAVALATAADAAREAWYESAAVLGDWFLDSDDLSRNVYRPETTRKLLEAWEDWLAQPVLTNLPARLDMLTMEKLTGSADQARGLKRDRQALSCRFLNEDLGQVVKDAAEKLRRSWWQEAVGAAFRQVRDEAPARRHRLRERGFGDMLEDLHAALAASGGARLARRVASVYPLIMVDEFQDTDPLQYEIFRRIHAADEQHGLVVIGDPKQAIYRFRGADVFTYLAARQLSEDKQRLYGLTRNYRSAQALLTAVNSLFEGVAEPFGYTNIPYPRVVSGREPPIEPLETDARGEAPTTIVWQDAPADDKLDKETAAGLAADITAREIAQLLAGGDAGTVRIEARPIQAGDVAVLTNTNKQGLAVQEALRGHGIAAAMVAAESVLTGAEAEELECVLRAVVEPGHARLLRRALATRLLGATAEKLMAWARDEAAWAEVVGRFREHHKRWQNQGVAVMLAHLFRDERIIERTLARPDGERAMTNLRHLAELLGAEATQRPGMSPLLAWFSNARTDEAKYEARQLRLESDEKLVRITTIHKAKGLQYPVVFLPYLWENTDRKESSNPAVLTHDASGDAVLDLGSPALDLRRSTRAREERAEQTRRTYVALTRAERACYIVALPAPNVECSALGRLLQITGPEAFAAGLEQWCERAQGSVRLRPPADVVRPAARQLVRAHGEARVFAYPERLRQRFHVASYSLLVAGAHGGAAEAPDRDEAVIAQPISETPEGIHAFPAGAASGTFLHTLIEALDFGADPITVEMAVQKKLASHGFDSGWSEVLTGWLMEFFITPLDAAGCSLSDITGAQRLNEMEFHFLLNRVDAESLEQCVAECAPGGARPTLQFQPLAGQMKGYVDLVFEHQGRYWIADYKSNRLGSTLDAYTQAALDGAMAEHRYDLQYLLYTVALHRYLATRIKAYDYDRHFGGVLYLFLRGMAPEAPAPRGAWFTRPSLETVARLDALLAASANRSARWGGR